MCLLLSLLCEDIHTCPGPDAMENITCMKGIHMFHQKLRGLLNDFSYLIAAFGKYNNTDTLTFSETHISCDSYIDRDELYYIPGYTFARESHKVGQNGDATIYIVDRI